ncbi:hypothetical protein CYMTET_53823 [Cymbomonas tetramitiformis]|uniref:Cilia- and flagella-associated protein 57 n=1 Tax=Cymbomonas tetramitiformis TaxID=36881 RepID=A0AAE0BI02_9CHLO|nr:hypothetical protein CYMTET_53823 [Cymbomonas tetramitiformis]
MSKSIFQTAGKNLIYANRILNIAKGKQASAKVPRIQPLMMFGHTGTKDSFVYLNETTVLYIVGRFVVLFHLDSNRGARFSEPITTVTEILALALGPERRQVACAEKMSNNVPQLSLLKLPSLQRARTFTVPQLEGSFTSVCFSQDGKFLIGAADDPRHHLCIWRVESNKILSMIAVGGPVLRVLGNPEDPQHISTNGPTHFKMWRFENERTWHNAVVFGVCDGKQSTHESLDHAWLSATKVAVATTVNIIFIVENGVLQSKITHHHDVQCIAPVMATGSFFVGSAGSRLSYYAGGTGDEQTYTCHNTWNACEDQPSYIADKHEAVSFIALSPSEMACTCILEGTAVLSLTLAGLDQLEWSDQFKSVVGSKKLTHIIPSYHARPSRTLASSASRASIKEAQARLDDQPQKVITGMDVCTRRGLVVTCGTDETVRVLDWIEPTCGSCLVYSCPDVPVAVTIHPCGYEIVVAYHFGITIHAIEMNGLEQLHDIPKRGCELARYSPSGALLAVAVGSELHILDTMTWLDSLIMKGHSRQITAFTWSDDSRFLISTSADGAVYTWQLSNGKRIEENICKGAKYTAVISTTGHEHVRAVDSKGHLREIDTHVRKSEPTEVARVQEERHQAAAVSEKAEKVYPSNVVQTVDFDSPSPVSMAPVAVMNVVVVGFSSGLLRVVTTPFKNSERSLYHECHMFTSEVSHMETMDFGSLLFATDDTGQLIVSSLYHVNDKNENLFPELLEEGLCNLARRLVLVDFKEQQERRAIQEDLEAQLKKAEHDVTFRLALKDEEMTNKVLEKERSLTTDMDKLVDKNCQLEKQLREEVKVHKDENELVKANFSETLSQCTEEQERVLAKEIQRTNNVEREMERLKRRFGREMASMENSYKQQLSEKDEEIALLKLSFETELEKCESQVQRDAKQMGEYLRMEQESYDDELDLVVQNANSTESEHKKKEMEMRGQVKYMQSIGQRLQTKINMGKKESEKKQKGIDELQIRVDELEMMTERLQVELKHRESQLVKQDKELTDVHHKNRDLATWRAVQTNKIEVLQNSIDPTEEELSVAKDRLRKLEDTQEEQIERAHLLKQNLAKGKKKQDQLEEENLRLRTQVRDSTRQLELFTKKVAGTVQSMEPKEWAPQILKALELFSPKEGEEVKVTLEMEQPVVEELMRQRDALEQFSAGLKNVMQKREAFGSRDKLKIQRENQDLMAMLNELRRENLELRLQMECQGGLTSIGRTNMQMIQKFFTKSQRDQRSSEASSPSSSNPGTRPGTAGTRPGTGNSQRQDNRKLSKSSDIPLAHEPVRAVRSASHLARPWSSREFEAAMADATAETDSDRLEALHMEAKMQAHRAEILRLRGTIEHLLTQSPTHEGVKRPSSPYHPSVANPHFAVTNSSTSPSPIQMQAKSPLRRPGSGSPYAMAHGAADMWEDDDLEPPELLGSGSRSPPPKKASAPAVVVHPELNFVTKKSPVPKSPTKQRADGGRLRTAPSKSLVRSSISRPNSGPVERVRKHPGGRGTNQRPGSASVASPWPQASADSL